jgi:hypothetical protein
MARVGLRVVEVLQAMLDAAQEVVGRGQLAHRFGGKEAIVGQQLQHLQGRLDLQRRIAAAADQLEHLGNELDFADAAGTELDVVGLVLLRHFLADLRVQLAHGVDGAEVEVLAKDEGAADGLQFVPARTPAGAGAVAGAVASERPRLDPGIAFPLAALGVEVVLQHVEGADQRAGIAVGPQPHVDAKHLAVFRDVGDGVDQAAPQAREEFEIGNRPGAVGIAVLGVGEDQVDVRRDIELAPAELAHADDDQLLGPPVGVARRAVTLDEAAAEDVHGPGHGQLGDQRHAFDHFAERGEAGQIARGDAGIGTLLELAQHRLEIGFAGGLRGQPCRQVFARYRQIGNRLDFGRQCRFGGQQARKVTGCFEDIGEGGHRLEFNGLALQWSSAGFAQF